MNFVAGCHECERLSAEYEGATMQWFRVQGQLRVAEYSRDMETSNRIISELNSITARRSALREESEEHTVKMHPRVAAASGEFRF